MARNIAINIAILLFGFTFVAVGPNKAISSDGAGKVCCVIGVGGGGKVDVSAILQDVRRRVELG